LLFHIWQSAQERLNASADTGHSLLQARVLGAWLKSRVELPREIGATIHYFSGGHAGTRFRNPFSEQTLMRSSVYDIWAALVGLAKSVGSDANARLITPAMAALRFGGSALV